MSVKVTVYGVPATTVDCTVRTSEPLFCHPPVDPSDPPMLPKVEFVDVIASAMLLGVVDPVSPVRVKKDCAELHLVNTGTLVVSVMVMVLEAQGNAEVCKIVDVMLAALIFSGSASSIVGDTCDSVGLKLNSVVLSPRIEDLLFVHEYFPPEFKMLPVTATLAGPVVLAAGFCTENESTRFIMYGCPDWLPARFPGVSVFETEKFAVL